MCMRIGQKPTLRSQPEVLQAIGMSLFQCHLQGHYIFFVASNMRDESGR